MIDPAGEGPQVLPGRRPRQRPASPRYPLACSSSSRKNSGAARAANPSTSTTATPSSPTCSSATTSPRPSPRASLPPTAGHGAGLRRLPEERGRHRNHGPQAVSGRPGLGPPPQRAGLFGPTGDGVPHGKTFGDWLVQVATLGSTKTSPSAKPAAQDRLEKANNSTFQPWQKAALGESAGATSSYIVPPDFYNQLLALVAEMNTFRAQAFVQPMAAPTLQFPCLDVTTAQSAGTSPFFGGVGDRASGDSQPAEQRQRRYRSPCRGARSPPQISLFADLADAAWNPALALPCRPRYNPVGGQQMNSRFLTWYISGVMGLSWLLLSLVTVAPGGESAFDTLRGGCVAVALGFAVLAVSLQLLAAGHWLNRSRAMRIVLLVLAAICSLFLILGVIG